MAGKLAIACAIAVLALAAPLGRAEETLPAKPASPSLHGLKAAGDYTITTRDGVQLFVHVFLPAMIPFRRVPAILLRSPYGTDTTELLGYIFVPFGFAIVQEEMRGTKKSGGNFTIWHDATDCLDTIDWIKKQGWSNGHVYTAGVSADGLAQYSEALAHPQLMGQFIIFAASTGYRVIYPGGAYREQLVTKWLQSTVAEAGDLIDLVKRNEMPNPWWDALNFTGRYSQVQWPSVNWGGWGDIFLGGQIDGFNGFQNECAPEVRGQSHVVVDALGHCFRQDSLFPNSLSLLAVSLAVSRFQEQEKAAVAREAAEGRQEVHALAGDAVQLWVAGLPDVTSARAQQAQALAARLQFSAKAINPVNFFVMGSPGDAKAVGHYWVSLPDWPKHVPTRLYLTNGALTSAPAVDAASLSYVYDPANPVPTIGGANLFGTCGPMDQRPVENRTDVLLFTSAPLAEPLAITGALVAELYVASNATDTDFTVKVSDVFPDGRSLLLQDGIIRMRWRGVDYASAGLRGGAGAWVPSYMVPGQVYSVQVDLWYTSYVFGAGHSIRVAVSSSNHPRFSAATNDGSLLTEAGTPVPARNTLWTGGATPSALVLPVVSLQDLPRNDTLHAAVAGTEQERQFVRSLLATPLHN